MTKEQILFKTGLKKLGSYDEIRKERNLTYAEALEENKVKEGLFEIVQNYGLNLVRKMTQKYRLPNDSYSDLYQDLATIFYEKYREYNPDQTTPCTYFVRYFKQVISSYLMENIHKLTAYDTGNLLKIRREINACESKGMEWTEEMLSARTGLSLKVVHSTLIYAHASNYAPIDDAYNLRSHIKMPEEVYAEKESCQILLNAIKHHTSLEEQTLLMMRINIDGEKELPYGTIARSTGLPIKDVKQKINSCICKIYQDQAFMEYFSKKPNYFQSDKSSTTAP